MNEEEKYEYDMLDKAFESNYDEEDLTSFAKISVACGRAG